jgi:D-alanyl-lipoteichoic acid acyltransferase DltB (MBOAT superfamily)
VPFDSLKYFLFLPVVYLVYYFVGDRLRWTVLLAASLLFYAALNVPYLLVVLALVAMATYSFGLWLDQAKSPESKRALLWSGIAVNVLILILMKYLQFLSENLQALSALLSLDAQIRPVKAFVAIGVSYYIFQAMSYLFDIYLEIEKPERHFGYFALYLSFFPKLLQGPIERAGDLIPQLKNRYEFNYDNMRSGMLLFTWGLFKKVVLADRLALFVDPVFNNVHSYSGGALLLATYFYAIQIVCDFSGYTDMALGTAKMFNINLTQNFNTPYLATSIADFWRRWHISFSRWILDYIFKPLQMQWRNAKNWGSASALIITFLISGIWHGASWGFMIWGGLHGLYLACSVFYKPYQKKIHKKLKLENTRLLKIWQTFITFHLVCFAWIYFRANNISDANFVVKKLLADFGGGYNFLFSNGNRELFILCMSFTVLSIVTLLEARKWSMRNLFEFPLINRWVIYSVLVVTVMMFNVTSNHSYIYFKF